MTERGTIGALVKEVFGASQVSLEAPDRLSSRADCWPRHLIAPPTRLPAAVFWPEREEQVARLVALARKEGFSLAPLGAGSGVCGGLLANERTVVVDVKRLRGLTISDDRSEVSCGAGVLGVELEAELGIRGLTVGHFPSSILCSTVGGWVAARGAGQCSGRYGKVEDMVTDVRAILGNGALLDARTRTKGPDVVPLLIGNEGTCGLITRVGMRLHPSPSHRAFGAFSFDSFEAGQAALRAIYQAGLRPAVARLYDPVDSLLHGFPEAGVEQDELAFEVLEGFAGDVLPRSNTKVHGFRRRVARRARHAFERMALGAARRAPEFLNEFADEMARRSQSRCLLILVFENVVDVRAASLEATRLCKGLGAIALGSAPATHWFEHRYDVSFRQSRVFQSGAFSDTMEVSAPWSALDAVYRAVRRAARPHALIMAHISHCYPDGAAIYFTMVGGKGSLGRLETYDRVWDEALEAAHAAGATLSHHHGLGRSKARQFGDLEGARDLHRALRRAWDPDGVFNPGVFEESHEPSSARHSESGDTSRSSDVPSSGKVRFDHVSQLASLPLELTLDEAENMARARGLTLGAPLAPWSIRQWLTEGAPRTLSRWEDPVAQSVAGIETRLPGGVRYLLRAAPRRAEGPDYRMCLVRDWGLSVDRVTCALERVGVAVDPCQGPFPSEREPNDGERQALDTFTRSVFGGGPTHEDGSRYTSGSR